MNAIDQIRKFTAKQGKPIVEKTKEKVKESELGTVAQQKSLVVKIAKDLGYLS
jgi:hypothetical protein